MLASCADFTASNDSGRGGSIMPTMAVIWRSVTSASKSPCGSKLAGSRSFTAEAITRKPLPPSRDISSSARLPALSVQGSLRPCTSAEDTRPSTAGPAPLINIRTTSLPLSSLAWQNTAMSL